MSKRFALAPFVAFAALASCAPMPIMQTPEDAFDSARDATDAGIDQLAADDGVTCSATAPFWGLAGDRMFPGSDCIACHRAAGSAARVPFTAAGTVFRSLDCPEGLSDVRVEIEDAHGQVVTMTTNAVGNFFTNASVVPPLRARATFAGRTVMMTDTITDGSCNTCHTRGDAGSAGYLNLGL